MPTLSRVGTRVTKTQLQGGNPDFALHTIGWQAFQDLAISIAEVEYARTVHRVAKVADQGRDGFFYGVPDETIAPKDSRETTIQCKHFSNQSTKLTVASLKDELESVKELVKNGKADGYILVTNSNLTEKDRENVASALKSCGVDRPHVFGRDWVTAKILQHPRVRALVPRVYGLGEITWITDQRAREQAEAILDAMGDDLKCYVPTKAHRDAVHALDEHRIVLLLGDPAVGKSTIAAALAVAATDEASTEVFYVRNPEEFITSWDPSVGKRLFWIDDAFGSVRYAPELADRWNHVFQTLKAAIKLDNRFVLTSRNYIWRQAESELKISAIPALSDGSVVVNVEDLTIPEKERILYNHLKFGHQSRSFLSSCRPHLDKIVRSRSFRPEIARRLGNPDFTKNVALTADGLEDFFKNPEKFLRETLSNLDRSFQAAIGLIFLKGGRLETPIEKSPGSALIEELYGVSLADVRHSIDNMKGSFVSRIDEEDGSFWTYKHPTIADAFARLIGERDELVGIYVRGAKLTQILREATCGKAAVAGSNVKIPQALHTLLIERIKGQDLPFADLQRFLNQRCGDGFFRLFAKLAPERIPWGTSLSRPARRDSNFLLAVTAAKNDCLPTHIRSKLFEALKLQIISEADVSFLEDQTFEVLLSAEQVDDLYQLAKEDLLSELESIIDSEASAYDPGWDVDSWFDEIRSSLSSLESIYPDDPKVIEAVELARESIEDQVRRLRDDLDDDWIPDDLPHEAGHAAVSADRSIFDDLVP